MYIKKMDIGTKKVDIEHKKVDIGSVDFTKRTVLLQVDIIGPVIGHGKGKYKFKNEVWKHLFNLTWIMYI